MTVDLRREGFIVNHKRVYRLMHKLGIQSVIRKKNVGTLVNLAA